MEINRRIVLLLWVLFCSGVVKGQHVESEFQQERSELTRPQLVLGETVDSEVRSFDDLLYDFMESQKNPLKGQNEEAFLLGDVIWLRTAGEKDYYLSPAITDFDAYYSRIKAHDNRAEGQLKSRSRMVRLELNNDTKALLSEMLINVPDYFTENQVNVLLPEIDIERLLEKNHSLVFRDDYGAKGFETSFDDKQERAVIWSEGWEGSMAPYTIGNVAGSPSTLWKDVNCDSYGGNWSLWCAGGGTAPQPGCTNYAANMNTYVYKTTGVNVSGYSNVGFQFFYKYDVETNWDYFRRAYSDNGSTWTYTQVLTGTSAGFPDTWHLHAVSLSGFTTYYWRFDFDSDNIIHWNGAYIDDLQISGTPPCNPAISPTTWNFEQVAVGFNSTTKAFTLINNGGQTCTGTIELYVGSNFTITSGGGAFTLAPGASRTINVRFNPASEGVKNDYLDVYIGTSLATYANLAGTGVLAPAISPTTWNFENGFVGLNSTQKSFVITNSGTQSISGTIALYTAANYSITSGGGSFTLAPGATRTVNVVFNPTSVGLKYDYLDVIIGNTFVSTATLSGKGVLAPTLTPSFWDFGTYAVGYESPAKSFTLTNNDLSTTITGNITVWDGTNFFITSGGGSFSLAPGASRNINVVFSPESAGWKTDYLDVSLFGQYLYWSELEGTGAYGCYSNSQWGGTMTPTSNWQYLTAMYAGEYGLFNVTSGTTYHWSLCPEHCGNADYDSQLTIIRESNNSFIAYSDDVCGLDARITWTATFTGQVKVIVSQYNCASNSISTRLAYKSGTLEEPTLSITPSNRNVSAAAGTTTFTLTSNTSWSLAGWPSWVTSVTPTNGPSNATITVNYAANTGAARVATITGTPFYCGTPVSVTVSQEASDPPGTWTGLISSSWHTAGNWSGGLVPTASTNVTIPAGTPYSPVVSSPATCDNITVQTGANLTITANGLTVVKNFFVEGTLTMNNIAAVLTVGQSFSHWLEFKSGSTAALTNGAINCFGWVVTRDGTTFNPSNDVTIYFKGNSGGGPSNYSPSATYGNIVIEKNADQIAYFSLSATQPLVVTGNFSVSANNTFVIQNHTMVVNGVFTDHSTSEVYLSTLGKNHEGISSEGDVEMSDTSVFRGGSLEIDTDFTLNGLLNVADGDVLVHGRFASTSTSSILINGGSFISDAPNHDDKGWQYIAGNLTMPGGLFEITHNSTRFGTTATTISGGTIRSGGAFYAVTPGVFQPTGGVVEIIGGYPDAMIYCYNGNHFYDLRINRSAEYSIFAASSMIQNNLYVDNGELRLLSSSNLSVAGNVEINSGGKLIVGELAQLFLGSSRSINVNNGGILDLNGISTSQPVTLSRISTGYFAINIENGGTLAAQNAIFEYMNTNGVNIKSGALVDTEKPLTNCTFRNGQSGGRLLTINNNQTFTISNAVFPANTWGSSYNVYKSVNAGNVTFTGYSGDFSGSAFEYDPNNRIHWTADAFTLTFIVKDVNDDIIPDAVITLNGVVHDPGEYVFGSLSPGTYNYSVNHMCYISDGGQVTITASDETVNVILGNIAGDANGDGLVNVSDVILIVNYYMGDIPATFCFNNADVNGDGIINVQDVIATVNIFMSGKTMPHDYLVSQTAYMYLGADGIELESDGTLAGLQFDINGEQLRDMKLNLELPDHTILYVTHDERVRAMIFSFDNTPIPQGRIPLVKFDEPADNIRWGEALAANLNTLEVPLILLTEPTVTGSIADEIGFKAYPNPTREVLRVEFMNHSGKPATVSLMNIHAQLVHTQTTIEEGPIMLQFKVSDLSPGVYLIRIDLDDKFFFEKIIVN